MNWGYLLLRSGIGIALLVLLFLSQRFWYRALWRVTANWGRVWLRLGARLLYLVGLVLTVLTFSDALRRDHGRLLPPHSPFASLVGLWFLSALGGYVSVKLVHSLEWVWRRRHQLPLTAPVQKTSVPSGHRLDFVRTPLGGLSSVRPVWLREPRRFLG